MSIELAGWRCRLSRASPSTIRTCGAHWFRKVKRLRATWTIAGSISKKVQLWLGCA
jgi:hypothetical protein